VGSPRAQAKDKLHLQVAKRIRSFMNTRGLSINRLADFSGIGRGRLSEILSGQSSPTLRTLGRLAEALEVRAKDLLPDD
jgi:transcriptional regulator with XRE-family HTH domain